MAHLAQLSDAALVESARTGSRDAYAVLWSRHVNAGLGFARSYSRNGSPEDLVSEAFTRIFSAIRRGGGPTGAFRAYLIASIRNIAIAWSRSTRRESAFEDFDLLEGSDSAEAQAMVALENSITSKAYSSLPARWQEVLWYSEVERLPREDIAVMLGMKANAVSQLTFRAREGLRAAWIQAHLNSATLEAEHKDVVGLLGARVRGTLSRRDARIVNDHVETCASCSIMAEEADQVGGRLAFVILPLVAGIAGAASYLAAMGTDIGPEMALAGAASGSAAGHDLRAAPEPSAVGEVHSSARVPTDSGSGTAAPASSAWAVGVGAAASVLIVAGAVWGVEALDDAGPHSGVSAAAEMPLTPAREETAAERLDRWPPIPDASTPVVPDAGPDAHEDEAPGAPLETSLPRDSGAAPVAAPIGPDPVPPPVPRPVPGTKSVSISSPAGDIVLGSSTFEVEAAVIGAAEVTVEVDGNAQAPLLVTGGMARGSIGPLRDGVHSVRLTAGSPATADHISAVVTVTLDTVASVPQALVVQDPESGLAPTLTGTAEPGATIAAHIDGRRFTTVAGLDGAWTMGVFVDHAGTFLVSVSQTDLVGNVSGAAVLEFTATVPCISVPIPAPFESIAENASLQPSRGSRP